MKLYKSPRAVDIVLMVGEAEESSITGVSKAVGTTYSHTVKIVRMLEAEGLATLVKTDRRVMVKLTLKGSEVYHYLKAIKLVIG